MVLVPYSSAKDPGTCPVEFESQADAEAALPELKAAVGVYGVYEVVPIA
jgi:hypothetical protein